MRGNAPARGALICKLLSQSTAIRVEPYIRGDGGDALKGARPGPS